MANGKTLWLASFGDGSKEWVQVVRRADIPNFFVAYTEQGRRVVVSRGQLTPYDKCEEKQASAVG